jgi:hypothetical protein
MDNLVGKICDRDDAEESRKQLVGSKSDVIFRSLKKSIQDLVNGYNERHPQGFGFPNAIWIKTDWAGNTGVIRLDKNIEPKNSLVVEFPINSGQMNCCFTFGSEQDTQTIILSITNGTPGFKLNGKSHTSESIADSLLAMLIEPTSAAVKRPIGFKG